MNKLFKHILFSLAVFLLFGFLLGALTIILDNTCCNGLWKSLAFKAYLNDSLSEKWKTFIDSNANLIYVQTSSWIIKHFLSFSGFNIFQQMALVNSLFGALSLVFFFSLVYLITNNYFISFFSCFFHFSCGLFLILTTNADDIMPAYAFYTGQVLFLAVYFKTGKKIWLIISILFFSLSWFMHWTIAVAPFFATLLALWVYNRTLKNRIEDVSLFLVQIMVISGIASFITHTEFSEIWFPAKAANSGWTGFSFSKFLVLIISLPRYIFGTPQVHDIRLLLETPIILIPFSVGILILIKLLVETIRYHRGLKDSPFLAPTLLFFLCTFFIGSAMNAYEFGSDSQFIIQPMMWVPLGYAFYLTNSKKRKKAARILSLLLPFLIALFSLLMRSAFIGSDTNAIAEVQKIESKVGGADHAFFITHGWDPFTGWAYALWGGDEHFHNVTLTGLIEKYGSDSGKEMQEYLSGIIKENIENGRIIVASPFWENNQNKIVMELTGYQSSQKLDSVLTYLKTNYEAEVIVPTIIGNFYRLTPKETKLKQE